MNFLSTEITETTTPPRYLSLQHELAMSIGMLNHLQPMLECFSKTCVDALELSGISYYILEKPLSQSEQNLTNGIRLQHILSMPESLEPVSQEVLSHFSEGFFSRECRYQQLFDAERGCYKVYFNLSSLGFAVLYGQDQPTDDQLLTTLSPIFHRLSVSCQAAVEHEQLLQAVAAKEKAEKIITHQLFHDDLTGLANRRLLMKELVKDISYSKNNNKLGALLYLDLDRFKIVNDTLGHVVGDNLLKTIAKKLTNLVRERDLVARLSGDEFAILLKDIRKIHQSERKNLEGIVEKIREAFAKPIKAGDHILHVTPSIGVEVYPSRYGGQKTTADRVLRNADTAMYLAKSNGPNGSAFYDEKMSADLEKRLEVEKELQIAVKDLNQFELFYQPQFDSTGVCVGAEALIRWGHPDQSLSPPGIFIPVAEETGLMLKLGRWVLIQSCLHLRVLEETGIPAHFKKLSVNVSAVQFNQEHFVEDLLSIVEKTGINSEYLTIELTESTLIDNVHDAVAKMTRLQAHQIDISIDDFGTGYSSLAYLNQYPISTLKIDQAFVKDLHSDGGNRAIVTAMIGLGTNLNVAVIAEGVETPEELDALKKLNCHCYQGYHFCPPQPFEELVGLLS